MADHEKPAFVRNVREAYRQTPAADPAAERRLIERLREAPPPRRDPAWRRRLAGPSHGSQVRVALMAAGLLVLVGGGLVSRAVELSRRAPGPGAATGAVEQSVVRFELAAPGAAGVSLVGDFNDWDPSATPMRRGAGDTWSVALPVSRGRHVYGFVVDRRQWLPDPAAPLAPEDGFGARSSVIVVNGAES